MIQPVVAVIFVIGLLLAVLFALRKKGALTIAALQNGKPGKRLELVERLALGPQQALHLVRAGDRCVLIATSPSSCQVLDLVFDRGEQ